MKNLIAELAQLDLLVDSREQYRHFHRITSYPVIYDRGLTQNEVATYTQSDRKVCKKGCVVPFNLDSSSALYKLVNQRRSCRSFSKKKLSVDQVGNICHYAYSIQSHAVPSGGQLYPLKIYVLNKQDQANMKAGYYEYDAEKDKLILFNTHFDEEQLKYCFNHEELPFLSPIQVIIAADLGRQTYKYSNRGYRLTLMEAGHVAQNIGLYCTEQHLGTCELGGILDEPMKTELQLDKEVYPLLGVAIGYPAKTHFKEPMKAQYVEKYAGETKPVKDVSIKTFGEHGSFFGATSQYIAGNGTTQYAGATGTSCIDAAFKALVEGYER